MRVTNSMISNSSQAHITKAKNQLLTYENQYTTQKKILRPSDDPTVAIRSLQLRTTYSQIQQYAEKNVKDAMSWMDTTESALKNINSVLENMKGYLNQGANDYLESDQRNSVLSVLKEYASSIFEDEANTDYSGRYMFTGYRTDTSLLFPADTSNLEYEITENFSSKSIDTIKCVTGGANYAAGSTAEDYAEDIPKQVTSYRLQLAYDNCSTTAITGSDTGDAVSISISYKAADGSTTVQPLNVGTVASSDENAYDIDAYNAANGTSYDALCIADKGTMIISSDVYAKIQKEDADISIDYTKKEFDKSDIRPEMYFACKSYDTVSEKTVSYAEPSDQSIKYEINFSQTSVVNTQARDAISTDIYRAIDYIEQTVQDMDALEKKISDVKTLISNTTDETELAAYKQLQETLETEKKLRTESMTEAFTKGLSMVDKTQNTLNVAVADLGSRYKRLQLTQDKLEDQQTDTEEKLSNNEDVDIADAYINLTQADNLYQASLSATAKILGNSLLNYI